LQDKHVFAALDAKFGSEPTQLPAVPQPEELVDDDFEQARGALKRMISRGEQAVEEIINIARQSDHPRAFEVTGQLINTVANTAKDLLALQKARRDLVQASAPTPQQIGTQNNIVFTGSTQELLSALKNEHTIDHETPDSSQL